MKKTAIILVSLLTSMLSQAQTEVMNDSVTVAPPPVSVQQSVAASQVSPRPIIGFLSYDSALVAMPEYADIMKQLEQERQAYEKEMKRVEDEFNDKYEEFLENRKDFPRTILLKRQTELQTLLQQNVAFRNQGRRELREREQQLLAPLREKLQNVIAAVASEQRLMLVVNTDSDACPFIEPAVSMDLNQLVLMHMLRQR